MRLISSIKNEKINKNLELGAGGKKEPRDSRQKALLISSRSGPEVNDAPCGRGDGADKALPGLDTDSTHFC